MSERRIEWLKQIAKIYSPLVPLLMTMMAGLAVGAVFWYYGDYLGKLEANVLMVLAALFAAALLEDSYERFLTKVTGCLN